MLLCLLSNQQCQSTYNKIHINVIIQTYCTYTTVLANLIQTMLTVYVLDYASLTVHGLQRMAELAAAASILVSVPAYLKNMTFSMPKTPQ